MIEEHRSTSMLSYVVGIEMDSDSSQPCCSVPMGLAWDSLHSHSVDYSPYSWDLLACSRWIFPLMYDEVA